MLTYILHNLCEFYLPLLSFSFLQTFIKISFYSGFQHSNFSNVLMQNNTTQDRIGTLPSDS